MNACIIKRLCCLMLVLCLPFTACGGDGGALSTESTDGSYHIQKRAYDFWVDILRDYAAAKSGGTWQNLTEMPALVHPSLITE